MLAGQELIASIAGRMKINKELISEVKDEYGLLKKKVLEGCIIAHVTTVNRLRNDRLVRKLDSSHRSMKEQFLDNRISREERGITVKLNGRRLSYKAKGWKLHAKHDRLAAGLVDFNYESIAFISCLRWCRTAMEMQLSA